MTELWAAAGGLEVVALKDLRLLAVQGPRLLAAELLASGPAEAEPFVRHEPSAGLVVVESSVVAGTD